MHMANELLSVPVATGAIAVAGTFIGILCRTLRNALSSEKFALMGVLGAFVFAAQMVNFQLPLLPGTSGHMVGAVLLAIILGPAAASIVMTSIIIVQCLIFQDGGLLALGCNILNMAIIPSFLGYWIYKVFAGLLRKTWGLYVASILASIIAIEAGAMLVPIQAMLSGVLTVPFKTFLVTMLGVHLIVGIVEGAITAAVLGFLSQAKPDIVTDKLPGKSRMTAKMLVVTLAVFAVITGAGLSLLASQNPDGLEWSYLERPDNPNFKPLVHNQSSMIAAIDRLQSKYAPMPDYTIRASQNASSPAAGWTSLAAIFGSVITMSLIYVIARAARPKPQPATHTHSTHASRTH